MAPPINFSLAFKSHYRRWVVFTETFQALKTVNIHNNIQTVTFTNNT